MDYFIGTTTQISPCIVAKAKYALKIKNKKSANKKLCTYNYWCRVIDTLSTSYNISNKISEEVKISFQSFVIYI